MYFKDLGSRLIKLLHVYQLNIKHMLFPNEGEGPVVCWSNDAYYHIKQQVHKTLELQEEANEHYQVVD